jgi:hypothetical protein
LLIATPGTVFDEGSEGFLPQPTVIMASKSTKRLVRIVKNPTRIDYLMLANTVIFGKNANKLPFDLMAQS